jgi:hypothetical protein
MKFQTLDLRDEATERQFLQSLRQLGVPIPDGDLMVGVHWDIKAKIKTYNDELKEKTIAQQQAKMDTYVALTAKGLPVPVDLRQEVESVLQQGMPAGGAGMGGVTPGVSGPGEPPAGDPTGGAGAGPDGSIMMPPVPGGLGGGPGTVPPGGGPPPASPMPAGPRGTVPEVSNERRPGLNYGPTANVRTARATYPMLDEFIKSHYEEFNGEQQDTLGIPFEDYVVASVEDLEELNDERLEELYSEWPKHAARYQAAVAQEVVRRMMDLKAAAEAARLPEVESAEEADEDKPLVLARNQELRTRDDGTEYIYESRSKKRSVVDLPPEKKYSIVDPEAESLPSEETIESDS